jgi:lipopolysaccharide export system protein LptC
VVILVIVALYAIFAGVYDYRIQWLILALIFGYAISWYLSESRKTPGEQARKKRQTITFITVLAFTLSI